MTAPTTTAPAAPHHSTTCRLRRPGRGRHRRQTLRPCASGGNVYRATCPLVGWEELAGALGDLYPPQLHLHHFVVVEVTTDACGEHEGPPPAVAAYDFLPVDATSPFTAAVLLSGGSVPGVARRRTLRGVPRHRCKLMGCTTLSDPHAAAAAFQSSYDRPLQLLRSDCTHHVDELLQHLLHPQPPT